VEKIEEILNQKIYEDNQQRWREQESETMNHTMNTRMIASYEKIEFEIKIQYIIEGIPDEPMSKTILYDGTSVT